MSPLRFRAAERVTESKHGRWKGGRYVSGGYVHVKVVSHPRQDVRGYVPEHILVAEESVGRHLNDGEYVHHRDGNRQNNDPSNLEVMYSHKEHMDEHPRKRNANKQFVAAEPIFDEIKFRLHDADAGVTKVYTLSKLINTTFRRGKFQFRGRFTGLHDKNGKEIFEGDIVRLHERNYSKERGPFLDPTDKIYEVKWHEQTGFDPFTECSFGCYDGPDYTSNQYEVIGNVHQNPELLPSVA